MSNKKSFIAKVEEFILKSMKLDFMDSEDKVNDFLNERLNAPEKVPKSIFKSINLNGIQVFPFGDENSSNIIVYIHGGAFVNEINYQHYLFCALLSKRLDAYVIAPVYPLTPKYTYEKTFEMITDLYKSLIEKNENKNMVFMGDSAGGGFVLSFCQDLKTSGLPQPDKIIVFSPWVDVSMSNSPYENEYDSILGEIGLREIGKAWAGDLDTNDYRVSPLFGDNHDLAKTLIFVGDNEIFYKDVLAYYERLKEDDVEARLVVGDGMFHIYPLFPCPEAWDAFKEIKKEFEY